MIAARARLYSRAMGAWKTIYIVLALSPPALAAAQPVAAQTGDAAPPSTAVSEVVVTRDKAGLLEKKPDATVLGLDKPLMETPRTATFIGDVTLERYGATTVDDLVALSPGAFTASYYGVPGALNLRGTLAETYFRGFKTIENRGTYTTPIGDAARIDIVNGPPSPVYGPGKVGGFLDFTPKTEEGAALATPAGQASATLGDYRQKDFTVQGGAPMRLGPVAGGLYGYGEYHDSHSGYRGVYPKHDLIGLAGKLDLPDGWRLEAGGQYFHDDGDVQTPGWNRLTQDLIDSSTYITGRNTSLVDSNHDGRLEPAEVGPGTYPYGANIYQAYFGSPPPVDPRFVLDTGVGTTRLSRRTVFVSNADVSHTIANTYYADLDKDLGHAGSLKVQLFFNNLDNKRFVSYGFPAWYRAYVVEGRVTYDFKLGASGGPAAADTIVGASYRYTQAHRMESYNSGLIALDRRDLSYGPTPTDIFDDPFLNSPGLNSPGLNSPGGLGWDIDLRSRERDAGLFATTDITLVHRLDLILGGRFDAFNVASRDDGALSFEPAGTLRAGKGKWTQSSSLTYKLPFGLMPYVTYAQEAALELGQASDIPTSAIAGGGWLSKSDLREAGIKLQGLGGALLASLDTYRQTRTQFAGLNQALVGTIGKGTELQARWLATRNLSFTFAGDIQHTEVKGPDHSVIYLPAYAVGLPLADSFGGSYLTFDFSTLPGRGGNYAYAPIPHGVFSLYANYITDRRDWGRAGVTAGASHVSKTSGTIQDAVAYPAYVVANGSAFYERAPWTAEVNVDNLFDTLYFTPQGDPTYTNVAALPSIGRTWRVTLKRTF